MVDSTAEKNKVIAANHDAIVNNMTAYFLVVAAALVIVLVVGIIAYPAKWESITERPLSYWAPWALALALWIFGARKFWDERQWIYDHAHEWAANVMFVFIGLVVINISYHKWRDEHTRVRTQAPAVKLRFYQRKPGAIAYGAIAAFMVIGFLLFRGYPTPCPQRSTSTAHSGWRRGRSCCSQPSGFLRDLGPVERGRAAAHRR